MLLPTDAACDKNARKAEQKHMQKKSCRATAAQSFSEGQCERQRERERGVAGREGGAVAVTS